MADFDGTTRATFRIASPTRDRAPAVGSSRFGVASTVLNCTLAPNEQLIVEPAANWISDWRDYCLLLASVWTDKADAWVVVTIQSGPDPNKPMRYITKPLSLAHGFNRVILDLTDADPRLDPRTVRGISAKFGSPDGDLAMALDDLALVDNTQAILASPRAEAGSLYAEVRGQGLRVGIAGRFELEFAAGAIRRAYDLRYDPRRLASLCLDGPLGPVPMIDANTGVSPKEVQKDPWEWAGPPSNTLKRAQRLIEASPVRIVVECTWTNPPAATSPQSGAGREIRWLFQLDRHGRVRVSTQAPRDPRGPVPLAVIFDAAQGGRWDCQVHPATDDRLAYAQCTAVSGDTGERQLVWIAPNAVTPVRVETMRCVGATLRAAVFVDAECLHKSDRHESLLIVAPDREVTGPDLTALCADSITPAAATPVISQEPDSGAYRVTPVNGRARFTLGQDGIVRTGVLLEISGSAGKSVTAAVNGAILPTEHRTANGNVLLELAEVRGPAHVEVFVQ